MARRAREIEGERCPSISGVVATRERRVEIEGEACPSISEGLEVEGERCPSISRCFEIEGEACPSISNEVKIEGEDRPSILVGFEIEGEARPAISLAPDRGNMPKTSQTTKADRARSVLQGIEKRLTPLKSVKVRRKKRSVKELAAVYTAYLDALDEVRRARSVLALAVRKERAAARGVAALTPELKLIVRVICGGGVDVLGDFGWAPPKKPGPRTVAAKFDGVSKRAAGREANGRRG